MKMYYLLPLFFVLLISCRDEPMLVDDCPEPYTVEWTSNVSSFYSYSSKVIKDDYYLSAGTSDDEYMINYLNKYSGELEDAYQHYEPLSSLRDVLFTDRKNITITFTGLFVIDIDTKELLWEYKNTSSTHISSRGIVNGDYLYVTTSESNPDRKAVTRFDLNTGEYEKIYEVDNIDGLNGIVSIPSFGRNSTTNTEVLFFNSIVSDLNSPNGKVLECVALNLEDLSVLWTYRDESVLTTNYKKSPIIYDNKAISYADDKIIALDLSTGEKLWETKIVDDLPLDEWRLTEFLIDGNKLFIKPTERKLVCLNVSTGIILWESLDVDKNANRHMMVNDETLFVVTEGKLVFINANNGDLELSLNESGISNYESNVIYSEEQDLYFVSDTSGRLIAFNYCK